MKIDLAVRWRMVVTTINNWWKWLWPRGFLEALTITVGIVLLIMIAGYTVSTKEQKATGKKRILTIFIIFLVFLTIRLLVR